MNLQSRYLNPFQPFPERGLDDSNELDFAIENNMGRALMSAIAHSGEMPALSIILRELAHHNDSRGSAELKSRIERAAAAVEATDPQIVEIGLQTWPPFKLGEMPKENILLIGVRSSFRAAWTNQHPAPAEPHPDAWIYVPGKLLVVLEFKNDEYPLDATQICVYAHGLGHLSHNVNPGSLLPDDQVPTIQESCADLVLDAPWSAAVAGLDAVQKYGQVGEIGHLLSGQASEYLKSHIRPTYEGPATILDWLGGPDDENRRHHLRILLKKMGTALAGAAPQNGAITFRRDKSGEPKIERGTVSMV